MASPVGPQAPPTNSDILELLGKSTLEEVAKNLAEKFLYSQQDIKELKRKLQKVVQDEKAFSKHKHRSSGKVALEEFLAKFFSFPTNHSDSEPTTSHRGSLEGEKRKLGIGKTTTDEEIRKRDDKIKELEQEVKENDQLELKLRERSISKQAEIDRLREREKYHRAKAERLEEKVQQQEDNPSEVSQPDQGDGKEELRKEVIELQHIIDVYEEQLQSDTVELYDEDTKQYTSKTQRCVQQLLTLNVATTPVGDVLTSVVKLTGKRPYRVPS